MKKLIFTLLLFVPFSVFCQSSQYCYYKDKDGKVERFDNITDRALDGTSKKFLAYKGEGSTPLSREQFQSVAFVKQVKGDHKQRISMYAQEVKTLSGKGKADKSDGIKKDPILCSWKGEVDPGKMLISTLTWQVVFSDAKGENVILKRYDGVISASAKDFNEDSVATYVEEKGIVMYAIISNKQLSYIAGSAEKQTAALNYAQQVFASNRKVVDLLNQLKEAQAKPVKERAELARGYWAKLSQLYFQEYFVEM